MEQQRPNMSEQVPWSDWEETPASVKKLVEGMAQQIENLEKQLTDISAVQQQLLEKTRRTSKNSSSPPSFDPPGLEKKPQKNKSKRKRGGQPGHDGHSRDLYPIERCNQIIDHHPSKCSCCGKRLRVEDQNPYRHQIVEIPPIEPIVIEHRLHSLKCGQCQRSTRAKLPEEVNRSGYGVRVVAMVALLRVVYRNSQRQVQSALAMQRGLGGFPHSLLHQDADLFEKTMSLGTVNKLRQEASDAVASSVEDAKLYVQHSLVVGAARFEL
ncbi:MAG: hypothetical protein F6K50_42935 [Moorea sp. SIO3I7]|uniref:DUF6444 domain-containing protein n=2 Tax=Moorena TaxID=1155738 RepID=UPI0013BF1211|nr:MULTISPECIES: DUF6444 domain-containing protein [unclassified Moorena]NEO01900.1 hypothetical protein [Moorena sp. SIO3I7]NEO10238.1 hypothetical protein [Moorena sp. SIO3I8]NEQ61939.1 hypothetical protein [Moorena sp. SIO4A1]